MFFQFPAHLGLNFYPVVIYSKVVREYFYQSDISDKILTFISFYSKILLAFLWIDKNG